MVHECLCLTEVTVLASLTVWNTGEVVSGVGNQVAERNGVCLLSCMFKVAVYRSSSICMGQRL